MISPPGLLIATLWLVAAGPKWLMMVSGIAHHYVMLIRGSNRQRFRIPDNFTARPPDYRGRCSEFWCLRPGHSAGKIYNSPDASRHVREGPSAFGYQ